jgi:hypothetical protein
MYAEVDFPCSLLLTPSLFFFLSFSVVTAEEMADRDSELAEAHRRRVSNASSSGTGTENQHHVTGFLASQTLALFLAVPNIQPTISNTAVR